MTIELTEENLAKLSDKFITARNYVTKNEKRLREKYSSKVIAFLHGAIIDSDEDVFKLWERVSKKPYEDGDINNYPEIGKIDSLIAKLNFGPFEEDILGVAV